jgi:hypothetical protein
LLTDCLVITNKGVMFVCFEEEDLATIKRVALEIGDKATLDINIHLDNGKTRRVEAKPNYILMKMCIEGGKITN